MDEYCHPATAAELALDAFWKKITECYPSATTGDLDPLVMHTLEETAKLAVKTWVYYNVESDDDED